MTANRKRGSIRYLTVAKSKMQESLKASCHEVSCDMQRMSQLDSALEKRLLVVRLKKIIV
jgi:hypothetical protein